MAESGICSIEGCGKRAHGRGWCGAHYGRWLRLGDPLASRPVRRDKATTGEIDTFIADALASETDDCIVWPFALFKTSQYGQIMLGPHRGGGELRPFGAHAYICNLAHGEPPEPNMEAAHRCGTKLCINRRHLRWATSQQNMADKVSHDRLPIGEKVGTSTHTEELVRRILELKGVMSQREIAKLVGSSKTNVARIHRGEIWAHITKKGGV